MRGVGVLLALPHCTHISVHHQPPTNQIPSLCQQLYWRPSVFVTANLPASLCEPAFSDRGLGPVLVAPSSSAKRITTQNVMGANTLPRSWPYSSKWQRMQDEAAQRRRDGKGERRRPQAGSQLSGEGGSVENRSPGGAFNGGSDWAGGKLRSIKGDDEGAPRKTINQRLEFPPQNEREQAGLQTASRQQQQQQQRQQRFPGGSLAQLLEWSLQRIVEEMQVTNKPRMNTSFLGVYLPDLAAAAKVRVLSCVCCICCHCQQQSCCT